MPRANKRSDSDPAATIEATIHRVRGERVIPDADLARIYGVETKVLNQAVKRNRLKFPPDFLLELTRAEAVDLQSSRRQQDAILRSQIVTVSKRNVRHPPFAFTEHGAIMAATILHSPSAVQMSVFVVRAFIKMRSAIVDVLQRIMALLDPPPPPPGPPQPEMGFHATLKTSRSQSDGV